jgi:hypothetical protein
MALLARMQKVWMAIIVVGLIALVTAFAAAVRMMLQADAFIF